MKLYTTKMVARLLKFTDGRYIRRLIVAGKLKAHKVYFGDGEDDYRYAVDEKQLEEFENNN